MSCINKQTIYRTFFWLDKKNIPFRPVDGIETNNIKSVKARIALCNLWLEAFEGLDEGIWNAVIKIVLAECKQYPSIEQLYDFIGRVNEEQERTSEAEQPAQPSILQPEPVQTPVAETPKYRRGDLQQMFSLAKQGLWKEAAACAGHQNNDERVMTYAKKYYPAKTSEIWIKKNKEALLDLVREEERCSACLGYYRCNSGGFTHIGLLDKDGNIIIQCMECIKRIGANEKIQ